MKVSLIALGCPKNIVEAEYLLAILQDKKFEIVNDLNFADVIIIHTCSFINDARIESQNCIVSALKFKEKNGTKVYVSGCLPQLLKNEIYEKYPNIDGCVGTGDLDKLAGIIKKKKDVPKKFSAGGLNFFKRRILTNQVPSAYLKIAEGCNHHCSYCIIPNLRGNYQSRTINSLIKEAKDISNANVKELIIVAQDTTNYGLDIYNEYSLDKLLSKIAKECSFKWIRLMYAYPTSITDNLLKVINSYDNICSYIDIPIQHSNKKILSLMHRPLNTVDTIKKIKNKYPDIILRTSLISGFPGETNKEFNEMANFIKQGYFEYVGVFAYSDEKTAKSSKLKNKVSNTIALKRKEELEKIHYENVFKKFVKNLKNKDFDIFVEIKDKNKYLARTYFQSPEIDGNIIINTNKNLQLGNFYKAQIVSNKGYNLTAKIK